MACFEWQVEIVDLPPLARETKARPGMGRPALMVHPTPSRKNKNAARVGLPVHRLKPQFPAQPHDGSILELRSGSVPIPPRLCDAGLSCIPVLPKSADHYLEIHS
jgi:hypothetical protein